MAVDLTQYQDGDDILITLRARVWVEPTIGVWARILSTGHNISLGEAVTAEHVAPEITPGAYYLDGPDLYVGMGGHRLFGPVGPASGGGHTRHPDEVALLRGLRRAEVRAAVPA